MNASNLKKSISDLSDKELDELIEGLRSDRDNTYQNSAKKKPKAKARSKGKKKVEINTTDISPEDARKLLAMLKGGGKVVASKKKKMEPTFTWTDGKPYSLRIAKNIVNRAKELQAGPRATGWKQGTYFFWLYTEVYNNENKILTGELIEHPTYPHE